MTPDESNELNNSGGNTEEQKKGVNKTAENVGKNVGEAAGGVAGAAVGGAIGAKIGKYVGRYAGKKVARVADNKLNDINDISKRRLGVVNPYNNEENNPDDSNNDNSENDNTEETNEPETQLDDNNENNNDNKTNFFSNFINKNKKDNGELLDVIKKIKKYKVVIIIGGILLGIILLAMIFIVITGPNIGAMLDLTGSSDKKGSQTCRKYTIDEIEKALVYVGDSRGKNIKDNVNNDNIKFIVEVGQGHPWLSKTARPQLEKLLDESNDIKFVVFTMGFNDIAGMPDGSFSNYMNTFNELSSKYSNVNFYFMSVNPVQEDKERTIAVPVGHMTFVSNEQLIEYNARLKEKIGEKFIDLFNSIDGYNTMDGVHYDKETSIKVHDATVKYIQEQSEICDGGGSYTFLDEYPDGEKNTQLLYTPIIDVLGKSGFDKLNADIEGAVEKAGKCTKQAAAAAGVTLAYNLYQKGYRLPYYWGGYHGGTNKGPFMGASEDFGKNIGCQTLSAGGNCYRYFGFDCSGFTSWAISQSTGQTFDRLVNAYLDSSIGKVVSFKEAESGDVLVKRGAHIRLVIENKGDYIQALESTSGAGGDGLIFMKFTESQLKNTGYLVVSTSPYFKRVCGR